MAGDSVPGAVVDVVELIGSSTSSFSDAVRNAVGRAAQTIRHIQGVDVLSSTATVENGEISNYKVHVKIAFLLEDAGGSTGSSQGSANADLAEMARREPAEPPYAESGGADLDR